MNVPSISIITATLNSARDLPSLLASLRNQTDRDFEHIVVDGGSSDETWDIVQSNRDVVTQATSEPDHGLYDALNKGVRASNQEFYLVLGADDVLYPDAIANYKAAVTDTNADVVVAAVKSGNTIRRGFRPEKAWLGHAAMITSHSVGMLFRKTLHLQFGYYSYRYPVLADGYFIKRACTAEHVKVVSADFIAGEFGVEGVSNQHLARVLCESWQIQLDTGENPLVQFIVFQLRLLRFWRQVIRRRDR